MSSIAMGCYTSIIGGKIYAIYTGDSVFGGWIVWLLAKLKANFCYTGAASLG
jgi:hypothetical protein